jgi:hypothetical protein
MDSTLLDSAFDGATTVIVSSDGAIPPSLVENDTNPGALILDLRCVESLKAIENLRDELTSTLRSCVVGIDASGSRMGEAGLCSLVSSIVITCRGLVELNLSYTELSHRVVLAILDLYDVTKSGIVEMIATISAFGNYELTLCSLRILQHQDPESQ